MHILHLTSNLCALVIQMYLEFLRINFPNNKTSNFEQFLASDCFDVHDDFDGDVIGFLTSL